jgi:hypothetical protein
MKLNQAWIVRWTAHGNPKRILAEYDLTSEVIDILSARHEFDNYIVPYAEDLYRQKLFNLEEKFYLAHYNHQKKRQEMFSGSIPKFTHYGSGHYRKFQRCLENNDKSEYCKKLRENFIFYPQYVEIGHNPSVNIKKVFNLEIQKNKDGSKLFWDEPMADGTLKRQRQKIL